MTEPSELSVQAQRFFDRQAPSGYLEEWVERLAQPEQVAELEVLSVVMFQLQQEYFALQTDRLVEVTLPQPVHCIPHRSNEVVLGLVNIRGQLRICVSAHGLLGLSPTAPKQEIHSSQVTSSVRPEKSLRRMLILHEGPEQWCFPVEKVMGVHSLSQAALRSVPATFGKAGAFTKSVFDWDGHTVGYLDVALLLSAMRSACK